MKEKELKRLRRSELLEIILLLRENEKNLQVENEKLKQQLEELNHKILKRRNVLASDDVIGESFQEMESAYLALKKATNKYCVVLEELGADAVEDRE